MNSLKIVGTICCLLLALEIGGASERESIITPFRVNCNKCGDYLITFSVDQLKYVIVCAARNQDRLKKFLNCVKSKPDKVKAELRKCQSKITRESNDQAAYAKIEARPEYVDEIHSCVRKKVLPLTFAERRQMVTFEDCARKLQENTANCE